MDQNIRLVRIIFWKDKIQIIESTKIRGGGWEKVTTNELSVAKVFHKVLNKGRVEEIFEKSDYEVLGKMLYEILTANSEVKEFIEMLIDRSTKSGDIRYKFMLQFEGDTQDLEGLPWEYLLVPVKSKNNSFYLSAGKDMQFDFVRDYDLKNNYDLPSIEPREQLTVIWIFVGERRSEIDAKLDFGKCEEVFEVLRKKNKSANENGPIEKFKYFKVKDPTKDNLKTILKDILELIDGPYVLHFLGHSEMRKNEGPFIGLSSGGDLVEWVKANFFVEMFKKGADPLRLPSLIVLQACESAQINDKGEGLAVGLIKQGVPAVVAMQNEISLDSSLAFVREFYSNLLKGEDVSYSMTQCRYYLGCNYPKEDPNPDNHYGNNIFGTPVLFTSLGAERIQRIIKAEGQNKNKDSIKICKACSAKYKASFNSSLCIQPNCNGTLVEIFLSDALNETGNSPTAGQSARKPFEAGSITSNNRSHESK